MDKTETSQTLYFIYKDEKSASTLRFIKKSKTKNFRGYFTGFCQPNFKSKNYIFFHKNLKFKNMKKYLYQIFV